MTDPVGQWAFTIIFVALALYAGCRAVIDRTRPVQAVGHGLHVMMALDMAAMAWTWWFVIPSLPQILAFAAATIWLLLLLVLQVRRVIPRGALGGHGPWHQVAHAVMMLAMLWMVVAMTQAGNSESGSVHDHAAMLASTALTGVAVTAALVVTGVILLIELMECVRGRHRAWNGHTGDVASGVAMSLGMAAMCWLMLAT